MSPDLTSAPPLAPTTSPVETFAPALRGRLGLNVPAEWWPTAPTLKACEAAGFSAVQVHAPPRAMLCDPKGAVRHAGALRAALDTSDLRLVLHAPDDLTVGRPDHDRAFEGLLAYLAALDRERIDAVVLHAANIRVDGAASERRLVSEERALRAFLPRIESLGVTFALENLAPVYPSPPRACHDPRHVRDLARRLDSERVGLLIDIGHAHITADVAGTSVVDLVAEVAQDVVLWHLHDNLGARRDPGAERPGLVPLRLDLHLPPGAGTVPWARLGPILRVHPAPLMLEVHPPHRPATLSIATVTAELLTR